MILISSVEHLMSETVSHTVSGRSVRSYIKVQTVMLNLGKSDCRQIWAEHDRCTDGADLWWLVVGELLPYSGMEKKVLEPAVSRLRLLDRIPEIPPHRAVCVVLHERRLSAGWAGRPWIGLVRFQISADEKGESWTQRHNHKDMLSWRKRERERRKNKGNHRLRECKMILRSKIMLQK